VHLVSPFDLADDATPDELRTRLRALGWILARAPVAIAVAHDAECRYISANDSLARLLGVPPGVNISLTPPPGEQPPYRIQQYGRPVAAADLPMQYAIAHRCRVTSDIEIVRGDGSMVYVQNDVEPLYDASGDVCGCVSVCVDITERKRVEDVLREADRRKDEFLATLSHELRNPLAPIRNALELMRRPVGDDVQERALAIMGRQLQQLVRLTDDLLDVSRITTNRLEIRSDEIDARVVIASAVETTQPLLDAAGHSLTVTVPDSPLWLHGDFTRLAQAIANLLNNAVKYTDRGGQVSISAEAAGDDVILQVRDTGIGIDPALMPRIFDMFMQVDRSTDRSRSGLGIGLTLARRLVELHGGRMAADSLGPGHGTTFTVRLPQSAGCTAPVPADRRYAARPVRCRVLIAEDIPDAADMLRLYLEQLGHEVRVAADGVQAVTIAREFDPRIALLDVGMPRMDGYDAAKQIRNALGSRIVLVALTGWGQDEDLQRSRAAGFDHHLTKPADPEILEQLIVKAAGRV
jgi:CheY-like chemotaxis protein/nitrogen-specific signal transduction histidine kinase